MFPTFLVRPVTGTKGNLSAAESPAYAVMTMEGRFHAYEGYSLSQVTLPVRVMKSLGVQLLIISNASGGMNPHYRTGDILVIEDHINLMALNPLMGINDDRLGPRFPDMGAPIARS